jgi:preprotein translocase subunit YajC
VQGNVFILAAATKSQGSPLTTPLLLLAIVGAFYFFLIRPQRNRQRQQQKMQKSLEPGTRVITTSGMYATVVEVNDDGLVLEIVPGMQAQFVSQAIMRVIEEDTEAEDEDEDEDEIEEDAEIGDAEADTKVEGHTHETKVQDVEAKTDTPSPVNIDKADKTNKTDDKA